MKKIFDKLKNTTIAQKIIFTIWIIFSSAFLFSPISDDDFNVFIVISLIAFVLFMVWAKKDK